MFGCLANYWSAIPRPSFADQLYDHSVNSCQDWTTSSQMLAQCFWWCPRVLLTVSDSEQHISICSQKFPQSKQPSKCLLTASMVLLIVLTGSDDVHGSSSLSQIVSSMFPYIVKSFHNPNNLPNTLLSVSDDFAHCLWQSWGLLTILTSEWHISIYG